MSQSNKQQRKSDDSRRQILQAAAEIASLRGYEGTTITAVSKASGLPVGSVYWHFKNKEGLFVALLEDAFEDWKRLHPDMSDRESLLRNALTVSAAGSRDSLKGVAFFKIGLILALENRLEDNAVRQKYLEIRQNMQELSLEQSTTNGPTAPTTELQKQISLIGHAIVDGFFIHANVEKDLDYQELAQLADLAINLLIEHLNAEHDAEVSG